MNFEKQKDWMLEEWNHSRIFIKWLILASMVGIIVGSCAAAFSYALRFVQDVRLSTPWIIYFLPFGGCLIVALYRFSGVRKSKGTNMVISAVRTSDQIPLRMTPLIFISTALTHLFGGSAGREGAALQIGGSLAHQIGIRFKLDEKDSHIITMCGMSAAFSALFGTCITAAIFPMEVISVGIMYYAALVPCAIASIIAVCLAQFLGIQGEHFIISQVPQLEFVSACKIILLGILCAIIARCFCKLLHRTEELFRMWFPNPYIRMIFGGVCLIVAAALFGHRYLGAGMDVIETCMEGHVIAEAFLLKMIFTAVTLGCGFKGGEIVPSFFVGAAFGCLFGSIFSLSPSFCAGIGLMSVFCGVTNCPLTSLFLSFELFGFQGIAYFLLADAIAYMLSGYDSLYHEQKIMYSKFSPKFIDKKQE